MTPSSRCFRIATVSALKDRFLSSSLDELVAAAERGEIDPDEVWSEVLESVDRSVDILRGMNRTFETEPERVDNHELRRKQDSIDAMIAEWRAELDAAGLLPVDAKTEAGRALKAYRGG